MPGRAEVDIGLPTQLGRPLQVSGAVGFVPQLRQAAVVDPLGTAPLLERPVRRPLPRPAGLVQPVPGLGRPRFARPALLRGLRVVAPEPLLGVALDAVVAALGEQQVRVGIFAARTAAVESQRIGQPLGAGQPRGEVRGGPPPLGSAQLLGQGELHLAVEPPVGALVFVRRLPVFPGLVPRPLGHVPVLFVLQLLAVLLVAPLALDVIRLGAGRLPAGAGTETHFKVVDRHAALLAFEHAVSRK